MPLYRLTAMAMALAALGGLQAAVAQTVPPTILAVNLTMPVDTASRQISVKVSAGLTKTRKLPTPALRAARKAMLAGTEIGPADLRALADHGDGLAAQKYVRLLATAIPPADPSDIAYYGSLAVSTGRVWSLPQAVAAMRQLDPETEPSKRKRAYIAMLYPHAWAGNTLALDAVIDLNGEGRLFGPMSEATRKRILEVDAKTGGRIFLRLALGLMQKPDRSPAEDAQLRDYLARAAKTDNLAVKTTSSNLLALLDGAGTKAVATQ